MSITSGFLKGTSCESDKTQAKENKTLRPTTNYTRQVLFNMLAHNKDVIHNIVNTKVLDGFCGTGIVGLEFASRGASEIMFIDDQEQNIAQIHKNATKCNIKYTARVGYFPHCKIPETFDTIFLDPPYVASISQVCKTITNLVRENLNTQGMLILEIENDKRKIEILTKKISNIVLTKEINGRTCLIFIRKED